MIVLDVVILVGKEKKYYNWHCERWDWEGEGEVKDVGGENDFFFKIKYWTTIIFFKY